MVIVGCHVMCPIGAIVGVRDYGQDNKGTIKGHAMGKIVRTATREEYIENNGVLTPEFLASKEFNSAYFYEVLVD